MAKAGGGAAAREKKAVSVQEICTKLSAADAAVLTEYRGLTVKEIAALRIALRPAGTEYKVFKNTLARRAAEEAGVPELLGLLEGPTAIAFVNGDAAIAAKTLREFSKASPALVVKGGLLGSAVLSAGDVEALADLPPREVLLARMAGGFQAPLVKAARVFGALQHKMAYAVKALLDKRVAAGEVLESSEGPEQAASDVAGEAEPTAEAGTPAAVVAEVPGGETAEAETAENAEAENIGTTEAETA